MQGSNFLFGSMIISNEFNSLSFILLNKKISRISPKKAKLNAIGICNKLKKNTKNKSNYKIYNVFFSSTKKQPFRFTLILLSLNSEGFLLKFHSMLNLQRIGYPSKKLMATSCIRMVLLQSRKSKISCTFIGDFINFQNAIFQRRLRKIISSSLSKEIGFAAIISC